MSAVEHFIFQQDGNQREILLHLHGLLAHELGLDPKIRFKIPFYYRKSWVCYLNPLKNDGIELAFLRGYQLSNAQGLLHSKGRKQVHGIAFYSVEEIPEEAVRAIVHEALLLEDV